ncbi:hypothetical protein AVHY2522_23010 [Acidovorax sp. SUPP2522]|uniref:hypothetical protein n=1 Tax=unclassified Acidovorax TaxID=2684926 RepID=UPI00234A2C3A|nr:MULTISPECIES: hypothetical protein [unclassified Acidovorax]WCM95705.1 hypothetical protein M5C96_14570 [Acidovorax sp. GBBC 1281]GKT19579.1 hypothetical protein AVHY2522_23010 [Acidovorax sp. SUPP2522]
MITGLRRIESAPEQPSFHGSAAPDEALRLLAAQGFIQFHPALAERLDNFKAAVFLGHALYWTRHLAKTGAHRGGWFFLTAKQWQQATGLTTREQTTVRELLVREQLLSEHLAGKPARLHFKVNLQQLATWANLPQEQIVSKPGSPLGWEALAPWFGQCVSFYRPLSDLTGSVAGGLYLSYLLQQQRRALVARASCRGPQGDGYFRVSQEDIRIALCLGPKTQRNARDRLKRAGLVHEYSTTVRLNLGAIMACLQGQEQKLLPSRGRKPQQAMHLVPAPATVPSVPKPTSVAPIAQPVRQVSAIPAEPLRRWLASPDKPAAKQLPLFGPMVARPVPGAIDTQSEGRAASSAPVSQVMSMFAPRAPSTSIRQRTQNSTGQNAVPSASAPRSDTPECQSFALLSKLESTNAETSKLECPNVETKLPFCRNHINRVFNKPPTPLTRDPGQPRPVDNSAVQQDAECGRGRNVDPSPDSREETAAPAPVQQEPVVQQREASGPPGSLADQPVHQPAPEPTHQGDSLVMPERLESEWHVGVNKVMATAPQAIRQQLLDELQGHLAGNKAIHNPPAWLHALVRHHEKGTLVLTMADRVAARREVERERTAKQEARSARECTEAQQAAASEPHRNDSDTALSARAKLDKLRQELRQKTGTTGIWRGKAGSR